VDLNRDKQRGSDFGSRCNLFQMKLKARFICRWLAVASVSTVCCAALLTWICMLTDDTLPEGFQPRSTPPSWEAIAIAYGILAFQVSHFIRTYFPTLQK